MSAPYQSRVSPAASPAAAAVRMPTLAASTTMQLPSYSVSQPAAPVRVIQPAVAAAKLPASPQNGQPTTPSSAQVRYVTNASQKTLGLPHMGSQGTLTAKTLAVPPSRTVGTVNMLGGSLQPKAESSAVDPVATRVTQEVAAIAAPAVISAESILQSKGQNGVVAAGHTQSATVELTKPKLEMQAPPSTEVQLTKPEVTVEKPKFQCASSTIHEEPFSQGMLSIIVLGASGDLAKKKTYPSLMDLFLNGFLPPWVSIVGFARSSQRSEEFRGKIKPWLLKFEPSEVRVDDFLSRCTYFRGAYDSPEDFARLNETLNYLESSNNDLFYAARHARPGVANRLFYFAIPPDAFLSSATSIKESAMSGTGFNRLIVEKPFGHNFESAQQLVDDLGALFTEDYIYRIDHYLAKELVQNLYMFRFGNTFLEPVFNHHYISSIQITFKEPFGTEGRGGYFTNYGIIRDVIQNHLMQVLSIVAMEPPPRVQGEDAGTFIRDSKNNVLRCIEPINPDEVVIGQYAAADGKPGYLEDDSIKDKEKAKLVPTFAAIVLRINNPRWAGVPFVLKAGKALNERKVDVRIQYKDPPAGNHIFGGQRCARNELVMRLQPDESVYMKINVKEPGLATKPIQSEMDLSYKARYADVYNPDAYTRLILEALRGSQGNFVRSDELLNSWKIFDPLLVNLEETEKRMPVSYAYGSRGPPEADELLAKAAGFKYEKGYVWQSPALRS